MAAPPAILTEQRPLECKSALWVCSRYPHYPVSSKAGEGRREKEPSTYCVPDAMPGGFAPGTLPATVAIISTPILHWGRLIPGVKNQFRSLPSPKGCYHLSHPEG